MKKFWTLVFIAAFLSTFTTACKNIKPKQNMIQSKRRFAEYIEPMQQKKATGRIDLSEGPKLKYDADLGPKNLNFDIKIVDPY